jgi:hypothetical protein
VYNALAYDLQFSEQTPGTLIVDVGTTSTDLIIAESGRMWVRTFPIGGHQFTDALVNTFKLSVSQGREAQARGRRRPQRPPRFPGDAIGLHRPRPGRAALHRLLPVPPQGRQDRARLIGIGSTFQLPGLRKYLKQQLSMDVYRIEEFKRVNLDAIKDPARQAQFKEASLQLSTAYGLALQGLGLNAINANLMPVSVLRQSMWKEKVPYFGIAAGVAVAASAAMFLFPLRDDMEAKSKSAPAVLREVAGKFKQLKTEADEAGVLAAGEPDTKAANLVGMLDKRDIYQMISRDVQQMFAAANTRAAGWAKEQGAKESPAGPAFSLTALETDYLAPTAAAAADPSDPGAAAYAAPDPLKIAEFPRIECSLMMDTSQPEPRKFVQETIERWLKANGIRKDVPYEIVIPDRPFTVTEAGRSTSQPEMMAGGGRSGGAMAPGVERGAKRISGGRDGEIVVMLPDGTIGQQVQKVRGAIEVGGSGPVATSAEQDESRKRADAQTEIDKLADFASMGAAASKDSSGLVRVNWFVVFKPPAPPEGDAAAQNGGAK